MASWEDTVGKALERAREESEAATANPVPLKARPSKEQKRHKTADDADADPDDADPDEDKSSQLRWWSHPEALERLQHVPEAFIETAEPRPYETDGADRLLPTPGFVTDFVNTMRGSEAPTLFLTWGALWTLSSVLSRDAWFRWYPEPLWPNLYVIYVAPPGLCKKSVPMSVGTKLLRDLWEYMPDAAEAYKKSFRFITNKATPDAVNLLLKPERKVFFPGDGHALKISRGSRITVAVSELATFLGKQQYNTGLVNTITDLYDCKDSDSHITVGRGQEPVKDVYVTFAGAITPMGLEKSIPEEAMGGGLMSRSVIVYQDIPTKVVPVPQAIAGYPVVQDLLPKLAWIATNAKGEYTLSTEALGAYETWYRAWKRKLSENFDAHREDESRKDVIMLKLAMLYRVQEYRPGREITLENFRSAQRLFEYTLARSPEATESLGASDYTRALQRVKNRITIHGGITRQELQRGMSKYVDSGLLTRVVDDLTIQGYIRITLNGVNYDRSQNSGREYYVLCEDADA